MVPLAVDKAVSTAGDLVAAVRYHRDTRTAGHRSPAGLVIITVLCVPSVACSPAYGLRPASPWTP